MSAVLDHHDAHGHDHDDHHAPTTPPPKNHYTQNLSTHSQQQHQQSQQVIQDLAQQYQITNLNRIKPSIAEATRAILRRVPDLVLLRDANDADTALLRHLTDITQTPTKVVGDQIAPYRAITLIQKLGKN